MMYEASTAAISQNPNAASCPIWAPRLAAMTQIGTHCMYRKPNTTARTATSTASRVVQPRRGLAAPIVVVAMSCYLPFRVTTLTLHPEAKPKDLRT